MMREIFSVFVENVLSKLEGVRETAPGRWIARCPAHNDKSPSLAIREADDRLLIHCFAGCSVYEVVSAIGMDLSDLFPESRKSNKSISKPFPASDILKCLSFESLFLQLCATDIGNGNKLSDSDMQRLAVANSRIRAAVQAGGYHE